MSSYKSNLKNWENSDTHTRGRIPGEPKAGFIYPCFYRYGQYVQTGDYSAKIKIFVRNTWDWLDVALRRTDIDYITHHCKDRKQCAPTLQKRGKEWFLDFPFEEISELTEVSVENQRIAAVDLGINNPATISIMDADGTILGREFLKLTREQDCLEHAMNRIKKAQQHNARRMPRLWSRAKGINDNISTKTANFIIEIAAKYHVDVIVFEHLDLTGKKKGSKRQKLHHWRAQYVQAMVTNKAHRLHMRVSRVNAWNTSRLAYDGSGKVERGTYIQNGVTKYNYSICSFENGKQYHCDLNATYNIGARYFIRERLKSLTGTARLSIEAKVPQCGKRSTCTLSTLISLCAELDTLKAV